MHRENVYGCRNNILFVLPNFINNTVFPVNRVIFGSVRYCALKFRMESLSGTVVWMTLSVRVRNHFYNFSPPRSIHDHLQRSRWCCALRLGEGGEVHKW